MITTIPFTGFYYTLHDSELDEQLNQMFSDRGSGTQPNERLVELAFDLIDWHAVQTLYAKEYCENLARKFKIDMQWESMSSPRFYNFTTDRVFATISLEEVKRLRAATDEVLFRGQAKQNFTSYDGFISSYSPDVDSWGGIEEWDHNQVGTLLAAYIEQEYGGDFDLFAEYYLMQDDFGSFETWLSETSPGIKRLWKIHDYLENRKERK